MQEEESILYKIKKFKSLDPTAIKDQILNILGITNPEEFDEITYIIKTKNETYYFTKNMENHEIAKKIIKGMTIAKNENELLNYLENMDDSSIIVLVPKTHSLSYKIIMKYYYENSYLFPEASLKFIEIPKFISSQMNLKNGEFLIFNKYLLKASNDIDDNVIKHKFIKSSDPSNEIYTEMKFLKINVLTPDKLLEDSKIMKEFTKEIADPFLQLNFDCGVRENMINYYKMLDLGFEEFTKFLYYMLDPIGQENAKYPKILDRKVYVVDTPHLASFYKKKLFNSKENLLYIHVNEKLSKDKFNMVYDIVNSCISQLFTELKGDKRLSKMRVIITSHPSNNEIYQIIPEDNQLLTIRYIDYSTIVYYNSKIKNLDKFSLKNVIKDKKFIENLPSEERSFLFTLKYSLDEKLFDKENLKSFVVKSLNHKLKHHLEEESIKTPLYSEGGKELERLSSKNFKEEFLKKSGKKIVMVVADKAVGCNKACTFLINFIHNNQELNVKYYIYNKFNENICLKKFETVPYLLIYDNEEIVKEVNVYEIFEKEKKPEDSLSEIILNSI